MQFPFCLSINVSRIRIWAKCSCSLLYIFFTVPHILFTFLSLSFDWNSTKLNAEIGKEMKMVVGFIVAALLLAYLIYTLVKPEKF